MQYLVHFAPAAVSSRIGSCFVGSNLEGVDGKHPMGFDENWQERDHLELSDQPLCISIGYLIEDVFLT